MHVVAFVLVLAAVTVTLVVEEAEPPGVPVAESVSEHVPAATDVIVQL